MDHWYLLPVILLLACMDTTLPTDEDTSVEESTWLVEAEDETEVVSAFPEVDFFSDDAILPVEIDLSSSSRNALRNNPRDYAPVGLIVGGTRLEVGIRVKGSSTTQSIDSKPSLKVNVKYEVIIVLGQKWQNKSWVHSRSIRVFIETSVLLVHSMFADLLV